MTLTDEKDRLVYSLSGNTAGIKPGEKLKLKGNRIKPKAPDKTLVWNTTAVSKSFGVCRP